MKIGLDWIDFISGVNEFQYLNASDLVNLDSIEDVDKVKWKSFFDLVLWVWIWLLNEKFAVEEEQGIVLKYSI